MLTVSHACTFVLCVLDCSNQMNLHRCLVMYVLDGFRLLRLREAASRGPSAFADILILNDLLEKNISGSTGFSAYESASGADDRSGPFF